MSSSNWKAGWQTVIQGTAITSTTCAFITGVYGILNRFPNYAELSAAAAINSGATAATFFSLREYVISPVLVRTIPGVQYARRRRDAGISKLPTDGDMSENVSWTEMRSSKLLDTGISGAITGGFLRGITAGRYAVVSGGITAGIASILVQLGYNELRVTRLKYVSQQSSRPADPGPTQNRWADRRATVMSWFGLSKYSDEEFLESMKAQRLQYLARIGELERQLERERAEQKLDSSASSKT
ncbi:uncharacterized protein BT62DRAFT_1073604 [Guyanagaster necrorhizus]|uniref:Uncharacterized protein n=1 Tax=Guyanagaster necrorhizus TaxID=856835 RepID=A0A9P7VY54_9AGAR|nr:uncharacterized protein BT62DRAFT_1073604 [Guyanagaster necrorhizus MCA 3950]KAG7449072.1 hypothetical protein BT62DRAFT_1073604 [Guyanagaster necrorhizus MCA 3950]